MRDVLTWLHFGDLHITDADAQNYCDLQALVAAANRNLAGHVNFAVLPGDNADQGTAAQFRLVRRCIDALDMPVHTLPGDHDFHARTLDQFHAVLGTEVLPRSRIVAGHRCLFLDVVSAGVGGPDFRLGADQLAWLRTELAAAEAAGQRSVVFMHAYPADLREGGAALTDLLARHRVCCVDMGHTHYNELANDGRTIFMATRSTGQIEEGPVGFSLAAIDTGVVSWRFQPLAASWPLVLVTGPADHRLVTEPGSPDQVVRDRLRIAARIWGAQPILRATATIGDREIVPLQQDADDPAGWQAQCAVSLPDGLHRLTVRAEDAGGGRGEDSVVVLVSRAGRYDAPSRHADGSDADAIGAWPEKHVLGTRLGPNRNGRHW